MGIAVDVVRVAVNTSTGNQTITGDVGGLTPKAALFTIVAATSDGTAADEAVFGMGAATGSSNRWAVASSDEHGQSTTDSYNSESTSTCVRITQSTDGAVDGEADFVSFGADNVTINWSDAPSSAWLLTVTLFAGSDLSAHANSVSVGNSTDLTTDITAPGFEPDIVFSAANRPSNQGWAQFGIATNELGGIQQRSSGWNPRDVQTTTRVSGYSTASYGIFQGGTNMTLDWGGEFSDFDASGFSIITRNAGGNNQSVHYLALGLGGAVDFALFTYNTPTSTGNDSDTSAGFTPQYMRILTHRQETLDSSSRSNELSGAVGLSDIVSDAQFSNTVASEDSVGTSNSQSLSDNVAIELPDGDGTAGITASFVSYDANGFTLNYSAVESAAKPLFVLAIEEEAGGATIIPLVMHHFRQQGIT